MNNYSVIMVCYNIKYLREYIIYKIFCNIKIDQYKKRPKELN